MVFGMSKTSDTESQTIQRLSRKLEQLEVRMRPEPWEDDISRNTLDTAPFENLPPVSERSDEEFNQHSKAVTPELLAGADGVRRVRAELERTLLEIARTDFDIASKNTL